MNFLSLIAKRWFLATVFILFPALLFAQDSAYEYGASSKVLASVNNKELPFWFYTNTGGFVDGGSSNMVNQLFGHYDYQNNDYPLRIASGFDGVGRFAQNNSFHFSELYGSVGYSSLDLKAGRFHHLIGMNNHELSTGSMMMSNNATPPPRIMVYTPDFVAFPFTDQVIEMKGMFSHGWFTDERYVEDPKLHQKYFYLRINLGPFSGTGGIVHNAVWGGTSPNHGRLPQSFKNYLNVVLGRGASDDSDAPPGEKSNVVGNSLGAYEFKANYDFDLFSLSLTRLFYLEDGVSRRFRSPWDGMWGTNFTIDDSSQPVSAITYEHINTKQQDAKSNQELGQANYYNHSIYRSGWANYGQPLGLPLMRYNPQTDRFYNNIIVGHHLGVKGQLAQHFDYKAMATYTRNYGTGEGAKNQPPGTIDFAERREDQYSFLVGVDYHLPNVDGLSVNVSTALDAGEFSDQNKFGVQVGLRWSQNAE